MPRNKANRKAQQMLMALQYFLSRQPRNHAVTQLSLLIKNMHDSLENMTLSSNRHQRSFIDNFKKVIADQDDLSPSQKQNLTDVINQSSFNLSLDADNEKTNESRMLSKRKPINFSNLPGKVNNADLHPNGKLLSDEEIKKIGKKFSNLRKDNDGITHLSKRKLGTKYSVIETNKQLYAIYSGVKSGKELGTGNFGSVKLAQNLQTGEWAVLKVQSAANTLALKTETDASIASGLAISAGTSTSKEKDERHRMLMHLVKGESLENFLKKQNHLLSFDEKINLSFKILNAFNHIHQQGITHGDTEARNIMINTSNPQDLKISLIDYGSATVLNGTDNKTQFAKSEKNEVRQIAIHLIAKLLDVEFIPLALGGGYKNTAEFVPHKLKPEEREIRTKLTGILDRMITDTNRPNIKQVIEDFKQIVTPENNKSLQRR